jgi:hypothetical protein
MTSDQILLLVQEVGVHCELCDVVQQGGPAQAVPVGIRQTELVGDQFGERSYAFCVAAGLAIVRAQAGGKFDDPFGRDNGIAGDFLGARGIDTPPEIPGARSAPGNRGAFGGYPGKQQADPEQDRQRQSPARDMRADDEDDNRKTEDSDPPQRPAYRARRLGHQDLDEYRNPDSERHRKRDDR